ncbi:MAG: Ig-like domain-containing protein [Clostridiaceae bacterium]|nr:Ig-like domain-containing protein [Clostridiaceae bacterium]
MKKLLEICSKAIGIMAVVLCVSLTGGQSVAKAAETTTLRVISTTDLHNQVNEENYEIAGKEKTKSLAQLSTMIQGAKDELDGGASITVDVGDSVYGYGSHYVMGDTENPGTDLLPIYSAMAKIGYDAITLGNHDFDYGYDFIKNQLEKSGLDDVCLVANVKDLETGEYPWGRTKIITKNVTTSKGNVIELKIGVVGVTKKTMSTLYEYSGILEGESMLKTVREQAAALKEQGADVVVVLAHTGMGTTSADDSSADVGWALSRLDDVDCVMLGHQHKNYPSNESAAPTIYALPNIDKTNGLTNGKPVVMVADHAAGIGVADLQLKISDGKVTVTGAKAEVRKCSSSIPADEEIASATDPYDDQIQASYEEKIAPVSADNVITGFFPGLEDNYAIQLNNEAKIRYGLSYTHSTSGKNYAKYPVIAATKFYMDGSQGNDQYLEVGDDFTVRDLFRTQEYMNNHNYIYWITGEQLKEWLEWSSSMFATQNETITSDSVLQKLMNANGASSLVSDDWLDTYTPYEIFDGIEYVIDASVPARYDYSGNIINANSNRITSLTCNGTAVTDSQIFVLVDVHISANSNVIGAFYNQRLVGRGDLTISGLKDYITELAGFGELTDERDYNWSVSFGNAADIIVRSSSLSEKYAKMQPWYQETLKVTDRYAYYMADLSDGTKQKDSYGPLLVLSPSTTAETNQNVTVSVQASDSSGLASLCWLSGSYTKTSAEWDSAAAITDNQLEISENGTYSICAIDQNGNRTVKQIEISNINTSALQAPTINKFTNKIKKISGEAPVNTMVNISVGGKEYYESVDDDGEYSCTIGKQKAGETITVFTYDANGRTSKKVTTTVLRRGPDSPTISKFTNKMTTISGKVYDNYSTVVVQLGNDVYVEKTKGKTAYKNCSKYNKKLTIHTVSDYAVKDGVYSLTVPVQLADETITVFAIDGQNRCSLQTQSTVKYAAPNKPSVNTACDAQKYVTGKIPDNSKKCTVVVEVSNKKYTAKSKKNGSFVVKTKGLSEGAVISVTASDTKNGSTRTSLKTQEKVLSQKTYQVDAEDSKITINAVNTRTEVVTGKLRADGDAYINYGTTSEQLTVKSNGTFSYQLPKTLEAGTEISVTRHNASTGEPEEVKKTVVKLAVPLKPALKTKKLGTGAKTMVVYAKEAASVIVKAGKKTLTVNNSSYSKSLKRYVYKVKVPAGSNNDKVSFYVQNSSGKSKALTITRKQTAAEKKRAAKKKKASE